MSTTRTPTHDPSSLVLSTIPIAGADFTAVYAPADHVVLAGGFGDPDTLLERFLGPSPEPWSSIVRPVTGDNEVTRALTRYTEGVPEALDELRVQQPATEFRNAVWTALRSVPAGDTISYTELAAAAGRPAAVRAAASACANNLIALVVPCHRIVRRDGKLGGYLFGVPLKERLLADESRMAEHARS